MYFLNYCVKKEISRISFYLRTYAKLKLTHKFKA